MRTNTKGTERPTEPRSRRTAGQDTADALRDDQLADTFDTLRDPRLQALVHRLTQLAPWPVNPEWLASTKDELLKQLDRTSDRETT